MQSVYKQLGFLVLLCVFVPSLLLAAPLHEAASNGDVELVKQLLVKGANVNKKEESWKKWTALHYAASKGHLKVAELLISEGANVNAKADAKRGFGFTPLMVAVDKQHADMVKLLIGKGSDVNIKTPSGWTALHVAANEGDAELVVLLINKGANINSSPGELSGTPLFQAVRKGHYDVAELLISKGADVNAKGPFGGIPLHRISSIRMAELMIDNGANVNAKDQFGQTPLHIAASGGNINIAELLISNGADINEKTNRGTTPLDMAIRDGHKELAELLMQHGAIGDRHAWCQSPRDIEKINRGLTTRFFHIKGKNAKLFIALDPIWSMPDFDNVPYRHPDDMKSIKEKFAYLMKQEIDEIVVWKFKRHAGLAAAVPFHNGCAVKGYGSPDDREKLTLMRKTVRLIPKHGLDDPMVRDSIKSLLVVSRYRASYEDNMIDIMIDKLRPLMEDKNTSTE